MVLSESSKIMLLHAIGFCLPSPGAEPIVPIVLADSGDACVDATCETGELLLMLIEELIAMLWWLIAV